MKIVTIESQPDFPESDISEDSAATLELLVQNLAIIDLHHEGAEFARYLYRLGHTSINAAVQPHLDDVTLLAAFSHGIGAYEAISTMVRPQNVPESIEQDTMRIMSIHQALTNNFAVTVTDARDRFTSELPRTTRLIGASARRLYPGHTDYAINGAAAARELEISALN